MTYDKCSANFAEWDADCPSHTRNALRTCGMGCGLSVTYENWLANFAEWDARTVRHIRPANVAEWDADCPSHTTNDLTFAGWAWDACTVSACLRNAMRTGCLSDSVCSFVRPSVRLLSVT